MSYGYHRIIRKLVVGFGDLFNNIKLSRYDKDGNEVEKFLVPILYGGKEKYVSRVQDDPNLDKKVQITLPIMSYEMINMKYDSSRKLNTNKKTIYSHGQENSVLAVYNPVPFDFEFELYAYVRNIEDGAQLIEKILPFFTPDYTISMNLIPEMGIVKQLPIILNDVVQTIEYEGEYDSKVRIIIWTLNFTVKGYLYGAVTEPKIIRTSYTNIIETSEMSGAMIVANMDNGGFGTYQFGEPVYQGYSYDKALASGTVQDWNFDLKKLTINNINGNFVSNTNIIGYKTNSNWTANNFQII